MLGYCPFTGSVTRNMKYIESPWTDPYYNLALEEYVFEKLDRNSDWLILWQNENTVVIGRNQNPWNDCRTTLLSQEGGHFSQRLFSGDAVFHDTH